MARVIKEWQDEAVRMAEAGYKLREMEETLGVKLSTIDGYLRRVGVALARHHTGIRKPSGEYVPGPEAQARLDQIAKMNKDGFLDAEIAPKLGISRERVRQLRKRLGLGRAPPKSRAKPRFCRWCERQLEPRCLARYCGDECRDAAHFSRPTKQFVDQGMIKAFRALIAMGADHKETNRRLGIGKVRHYLWLEKYAADLPRHPTHRGPKRMAERKAREARDRRIVELRDNMTIREIAKKVGCCIATVNTVLHAAEIK